MRARTGTRRGGSGSGSGTLGRGGNYQVSVWRLSAHGRVDVDGASFGDGHSGSKIPSSLVKTDSRMGWRMDGLDEKYGSVTGLSGRVVSIWVNGWTG